MEDQRKVKKIFVDSNYFVALFSPTDSLSKEAEKVSKRIDAEKPMLFISNFIFLEAVTIISQRVGKDQAIVGGKYFRSDPFIEVVHINESLQEDTWRIFQQVKNKNVSFVDCSVISVMKAEGIRELLTFDRKDFEKLQSDYRFHFYA